VGVRLKYFNRGERRKKYAEYAESVDEKNLCDFSAGPPTRDASADAYYSAASALVRIYNFRGIVKR
jgi:hypothetical protein